MTAITHRKDAIWYNIVAGFADHPGTGAGPLEGLLWEHLKPRFPSLVNVYMPTSGVGRYHVYLQLQNPGPGEARQAIVYACVLHGIFLKHVFAFDDDVDIFNPKDVMWAIATRSQWDRDVIILPQFKTSPLTHQPPPGWCRRPGCHRRHCLHQTLGRTLWGKSWSCPGGYGKGQA